MSKHLFVFGVLVVIGGFALHILAIQENNLFFTVDQGNDAVHAREIFEHHAILLQGPETNIRGVFTGPLWYYFIAAGYSVFGGHPYGAVFPLIVLNLVITVILMIWIARKINAITALLAGASLQFFWPFFAVSLWGFNPFPLVALAFFQLLLLIPFLEGATRYYFYGLIPIFFAFNVELAGAAALLLFHVAVGVWGVLHKLLSFKRFALSLLIPSVGVIFLALQFLPVFIQTKVTSYEAVGLGIFTGTNIKTVTTAFITIIGETAVPQLAPIGFLFFAVITWLFLKHQPHLTAKRFVLLTFMLIGISFLFFASNKGWHDWHTVYFPPLVFTSLLLMLTALPKKVSIGLIAVVLLLQGIHFANRLQEYRAPSNDPSILYNELKVIDWVYQEAGGSGFSAYNYTDRFYDYPYQYLFWWYGLKTYGYLPCEYANFPLSHKELYVPGSERYLGPRRGCDRIAFLIIQSETNGEKNKDWISTFRNYHDVVATTHSGEILVEKYYRKPGAPSDYCIWWNRCE